MSKKILHTISILSLILAPSIAGAQYYNYNYGYNNSSQIASIQAQINSFYQQIAALNQNYAYPYNYNYSGQVLGASYPYQTTCNFTQDLYVGSSGTQVADLNRILGISGSYFGTATRNAVIQFQNQYANEVLYPAGYTYGTGQVGPMTRAKLNQICNGVTSNYSGAVLGVNTYNPYAYNYNYGANYNYNTNTIAPTLNFYTSTTNINQNDTVTLTWNGTNLSSCTASDGWYGSKNVSGSESRSVYSNTNFTLTCYGTNGQQVTRTLSIYTSGSGYNNNNPVYITFTANPTSVFNGGTTALVWNASNAVSCSASGDWSGSRSNTGSFTVTPTYSNRTYTITCTNYNGQSSSQTVVVPVI